MSVVSVGGRSQIRSIVDRQRPKETGSEEEILIEWRGSPRPTQYTWELRKDHVVPSTGLNDPVTRAYTNFIITRRACHFLVTHSNNHAIDMLKKLTAQIPLCFQGNADRKKLVVKWKTARCILNWDDHDVFKVIDYNIHSRDYITMLGVICVELDAIRIEHKALGVRTASTCIGNALHALYSTHRHMDADAVRGLVEHVRRFRDVTSSSAINILNDAATDISTSK